MYICPICSRTFVLEEAISKHVLPCWKEHHPNHRSKDAPRSEDIIIREVNDDVAVFFNSFI